MLIGGEVTDGGHGFWRRALPRAAAAVAVLLMAIAVSACGSGESSTAQSLQPDNLIGHGELAKYPEGSVERTFLEFWSNLQFHSWADVVAYYDPQLRDFIGAAKIIEAKKVNGPSYPLLKPEIVRISTDQGVATVYYTVRLEDGSRELASASWRKVGGNWQIVYDSRMDAELAQLAQEKVQLEEAGKGQPEADEPLSREAVRAGKAAAQLQAHFLQQELQLEKPSTP